MKKSIVFAPAILIVIFLLNSFFVLKEDNLPVKLVPKPHETDSTFSPNSNESGPANIVFKSADGGLTWQDISKGLPEKLQGGGFVANESGLYLRAENVIYHSKPNSANLSWEKELLPKKQGSIAPGKRGVLAYNYGGQILQKLNGTSIWSPVYTSFQGNVHTVFETAGGTVLIGSGNGIFKSTNNGRTWRQVQYGGWVMKVVESNGVLLATSQSGILRSADNGESWDKVISEGGVGIAVEHIKGGFAAITYNTQSKSRRIRASYDGGKIWQPIDAGLPTQSFMASFWQPVNSNLPMQAFITSIVQVGEYFYCGHPTGIFRSSDNGKTWKLLLPSVKDKVFNLSVSGGVIYAIAGNRGC
jgi:photosystem II stability/assembly factor-like uncharacterized protein